MARKKPAAVRRMPSPKVVVLAGPNGAGKTTAAERILRGPLRVTEFVNADVISRGLSDLSPQSAALEAGSMMLNRLRELAARRANFAFETTLASRSFAPRIRDLLANGYRFDLVFLWLPSPEAAIARVAERVRRGGHDVPQSTIRRRYWAGLRNFFELYQPLATTWQMIDNGVDASRLIATGSGNLVHQIGVPSIWSAIEQAGRHGKPKFN